jgi:hypothetical protein
LRFKLTTAPGENASCFVSLIDATMKVTHVIFMGAEKIVERYTFRRINSFEHFLELTLIPLLFRRFKNSPVTFFLIVVPAVLALPAAVVRQS